MYLFKRLTAVLASRFHRFEHIVSYSSGKVVGKVSARRYSERLRGERAATLGRQTKVATFSFDHSLLSYFSFMIRLRSSAILQACIGAVYDVDVSALVRVDIVRLNARRTVDNAVDCAHRRSVLAVASGM